VSDKDRAAHFVKKLSISPEDALDRADKCCKDHCKDDCKDDCFDHCFKHDCFKDCCKDDCFKDDCFKHDCKHDCKHDDCCPTRGIGFADILMSLKNIKER
jgi:hypothetical protein